MIPREPYDCTVRALALASGQTYEHAYETLESLGRKPGSRFGLRQALSRGELGEEWQPCECLLVGMKAAAFAWTHPDRRWLVFTLQHAGAIVDGELHDVDPTDFVLAAWRKA